MDIKPFEQKVWLATPTMHGDELKYVTEAYETNWMSTVGKNIDEVERIVSEKAFELYPDVRVVVAAHLYGTPGKIDEIKVLCDKHGAVIVEDPAESLGATYKGRQTGSQEVSGLIPLISTKKKALQPSRLQGLFLYTFSEAKRSVVESWWNARWNDVLGRRGKDVFAPFLFVENPVIVQRKLFVMCEERIVFGFGLSQKQSVKRIRCSLQMFETSSFSAVNVCFAVILSG